MPLLGKELWELAAQRKTYVLRVVYAVALYMLLVLMEPRLWQLASYQALETLGMGRSLFKVLVGLQFVGLYLAMPVLMADVIAGEKERGSLGLLFLTPLRPWELLLQKFFGRLLPVFSLLLLSLPPMGVIYALGGLEAETVVAGAWTLGITALQAGALVTMCSAFCRSTTSAMLLSYLFGVAFYVGPVAGAVFLQQTFSWRLDEDVFLAFLGPYVFGERAATFLELFGNSVPILCSTVVFLLLARLFLVRRAFSPPRRLLATWFHWLDRTFARWNQRIGGWVLWREASTGPGNEPVAWRELQKRALAKRDHWLRLMIAAELLAVPLCLPAITDRYVSVVAASVVWILAAVTLVMQAANSIASERTNQTLEILLTTPLRGAELVRQKTPALRRMSWVFILPLATLSVGALWWDGSLERWRIAGMVLSLAVYPRLLIWLALWVGLKTRTRGQAVSIALGAVAAYVVLPILTRELLRALYGTDGDLMMALSPGVLIVSCQLGHWPYPLEDWPYCVLNFLVAGTGLYILRWLCLSRADWCLRRE
jgi:ABC-type transport system involved in multi-copper enzyme maturation permease subunit